MPVVKIPPGDIATLNHSISKQFIFTLM